MKNIILALLIIMTAGCVYTKRDHIFDGSTMESTKRSIAEVRKRLNPEDQIEFSMALMAIQFSDVTSVHDIIDDPTMTDGVNYSIIGKKIHGMNYLQVIELAKSSQAKVRRVY